MMPSSMPFLLCITMVILSGCNIENPPPTPVNATPNHPGERIGGACEEGYCELMYVGMPAVISSVDTSDGWYEMGQRLVVSGTVYRPDGTTPAKDVVIYYHHTDHNGYYSPGKERPEDQTRHGHLRGWVKTDQQGHYTICTLRPAPYPDRSQPAHIHWLIKEPDIANEYWADDLMFEDDELLLPFLEGNKPEYRCGNGIVAITMKGNVQMATRDFTLGLNIPNYPKR